MFNRESIEKNYKKVNDGVPPTENEKESLKNTINYLPKELQLELYDQWFSKNTDKFTQCNTGIILNLESLSIKDFYELTNAVIFILEENKHTGIVFQESIKKGQLDKDYVNKIKTTEIINPKNNNTTLMTADNNDNTSTLEYSNIYNSIIDQQRRVENDITLMENENYLSLFQIDRKDIMKIDM